MKRRIRLSILHVSSSIALINSFSLAFVTHSPPSNIARSHRRVLRCASATRLSDLDDSYDVIVVGSGIGGLSAAGMLAKYGNKVLVLESHTQPGGAAHGFQVEHAKGTFTFDTGPSFFSGLNPDYPSKASNPLRTVLDAVGQQVECIPYTTFGLNFPEGKFVHSVQFADNVLKSVVGDVGVKEWRNLMENMKPLEKAVDALPVAAIRADPGVVLTAAPFLSNFSKLNPLENLKLTKSFSEIVNQSIQQTFTRNWLDLLCFCLSGMPSDGTITAEMALMMGEFYAPDAIMDCPKGGAQSIVKALVQGLESNGGTLVTNAHVKEITVDTNGKATGVVVRQGQTVIRAEAVISNLSVWDLFGKDMIPRELLDDAFLAKKMATPVAKSFMHLHVGFRMSREELSQLQAHYMHIDDWSRGVTAEDNAVLVSIPSVHDPSLAPDGYATLHIYTPATEDYSRWADVNSKQEYESLKESRSQYLWKVLESIIPDVRERSVIAQVGTPLTHERFLRKHKGTYGPAIHASDDSFPFCKTPIEGLLTCGDSCFPGIGVPAVAGSGLIAAHSVNFDSLGPQRKLLDELKKL